MPSPPDLRSRARGCLLGGAVGDALGAGVEFIGLGEIRRRFPDGVVHANAYGRPGMVTDDTQMTLFTAEGLVRAARKFRGGAVVDLREMVHHAYLRWLITQDGSDIEAPNPGGLLDVPAMNGQRAPGTTCLEALRSGRMGTIARPINDRKGCGGVMRVAPVGIALADPFLLAAECAAITHGHPSGYWPAGVLAEIIAQLIHGSPIADAVATAGERLRGRDGAEETAAALDAAVRLAARGRPATAEELEGLGGGWVGEEALAISVCCALTAVDFRQAVVQAVTHSGDSDSTGAICGNILGAAWGVDAIPPDLLEPLELQDVIVGLADQLVEDVVGLV